MRRNIIEICRPYSVNKKSYLKPGSRIAQSGREDHLFDNMFELTLNDDYERNFKFRDVLRQEADEKAIAEYQLSMSGRNASADYGKRKSMSNLNTKRLTNLYSLDGANTSNNKMPRKTAMPSYLRNSIKLSGAKDLS